MTFPRHWDAPKGGALRAAPCVGGCAVFSEGVRGRQTKIANHLLNVEPAGRFSPKRVFTSILPKSSSEPRALLVANVPVASPHAPNSLSVSWRSHRRFVNLHRLSTRALRSTWTRFGAFRYGSLVGELSDLANAGCLGYAPADYLFPHPTISTHAAVYSVPGAQLASHLVLINPCPLPLSRDGRYFAL